MCNQSSQDVVFKKYLAEQDRKKKEELENARESIAVLKKKALLVGVNLLDTNFDYTEHTYVFANHQNILMKRCSAVLPDKEGLFDFIKLKKYLKIMDAGKFHTEYCCIMAHQYFRRNFCIYNSFAPDFIREFWLEDFAGLSPSIALDIHRVFITPPNGYLIERDCWYGDKFDTDLATIQDGCVKLAPPVTLNQATPENDKLLISYFYGRAIHLDIKWNTNNGIKTFQAEEIYEHGEVILHGDQRYHFSRYFHAEFDLSCKLFRHMDGAIRFYTEDEYQIRIKSDINHNYKKISQIKARSKKMFKINGWFELAKFTKYLSQFMVCSAGGVSPLIYEYLAGDMPPHIKQYLDNEHK